MLTAAIAASSNGDNTIVSAIANRRIRVLAYVFVADGAVTVTWKSGASTSISGGMNMAAGNGISAPPGDNSLVSVPHLVTNAGEALVMNLSSAVSVGGHLTYEITD